MVVRPPTAREPAAMPVVREPAPLPLQGVLEETGERGGGGTVDSDSSGTRPEQFPNDPPGLGNPRPRNRTYRVGPAPHTGAASWSEITR